MPNFDRVLEEATENIANSFMYTEIIVNIEPEETKIVQRERIYCYELYHQIRRRINFNVNGEFDKVRSRAIPEGGIPDLLVHEAGGMGNNYLIIEVKMARNLRAIKADGSDGVSKDIKRLVQYLNREYQRAIFLLAGEATKYRIDKIIELIQAQNEIPEGKFIEFWHHERAGRQAEILLPEPPRENNT